jgi:hypothetical protein
VDPGTRCAVFATGDATPVPSIFKLADLDDFRAVVNNRRPFLFVMTLKYSGKSFRKVVWQADQQTWARLHEEAFMAFGGSVEYVVLENGWRQQLLSDATSISFGSCALCGGPPSVSLAR